MSDWNESSRIRRDFRHIHGGPEEMPHRKKAKHYDRSKCEHVWSEWYKRELKSDRWWFTHATRYCTKCRKHDYDYKNGPVVN